MKSQLLPLVLGDEEIATGDQKRIWFDESLLLLELLLIAVNADTTQHLANSTSARSGFQNPSLAIRAEVTMVVISILRT